MAKPSYLPAEVTTYWDPDEGRVVQPPGAILEYLTSPCNGRTVGAYTWPNVTSTLALTTTYQDVTGSSISYTPPTGTKTVLYRFVWQIDVTASSGISHYKFRLDGTEVIPAYRSIAPGEQGGTQHNANEIFEWGIRCDAGTDDKANGELAGWTTPKILKLEAREYNATYQQALHKNVWRDADAASAPYDLAVPELTIIAIG
jgi:hypothetical protein